MTVSYLPAILSVIAASLLGSPHCAAMCGGFATMVGASASRSGIARIASYHGGRLLTYLVAGYSASKLTYLFSPVVFGGLLLGVGILAFFNVRLVPKALHRSMMTSYRRIITLVSPAAAIFPFLVGFGSTLLPCGWLYVYVGIAAAGQAPLTTMFAFWLGTLPILTAWSALSGKLLFALGRFYPSLRALLLVVAGFFAIAQHVEISPSEPTCHHAK